MTFREKYNTESKTMLTCVSYVTRISYTILRFSETNALYVK